MNEKEKILIENFNEYYGLGLEAYKKNKFNSATTLFFKALAVLCDLHILRSEGFIPSSHSQRFRILEEKNPKLYMIMDRDFPFYQDSYTNKMDEESARLIKEDVETIRKIAGI